MAGEFRKGLFEPEEPLTTVDKLELECQAVQDMKVDNTASAEEVALAKVRLERIIAANSGAYEQLLQRRKERLEAGEFVDQHTKIRQWLEDVQALPPLEGALSYEEAAQLAWSHNPRSGQTLRREDMTFEE